MKEFLIKILQQLTIDEIEEILKIKRESEMQKIKKNQNL